MRGRIEIKAKVGGWILEKEMLCHGGSAATDNQRFKLVEQARWRFGLVRVGCNGLEAKSHLLRVEIVYVVRRDGKNDDVGLQSKSFVNTTIRANRVAGFSPHVLDLDRSAAECGELRGGLFGKYFVGGDKQAFTVGGSEQCDAYGAG